MIIEKNTKYNQYSTKELRERTNEKFDSIVMHTFLRIAHIKKQYGGHGSHYLHAGHFTVIYCIWCWIPLHKRHTSWFTVTQLRKAIKKYLKFDMTNLNLDKYLMQLCEGNLMVVKRGKNRQWLYSVKKTPGESSN